MSLAVLDEVALEEDTLKDGRVGCWPTVDVQILLFREQFLFSRFVDP